MTNGWEEDGDSDIGDQKTQWDRLSVFTGGQATIRGATTASEGLSSILYLPADQHRHRQPYPDDLIGLSIVRWIKARKRR